MKLFPAGFMQLNSLNRLPVDSRCKTTERENFTLRLDRDISELRRGFSENTRRNLKKAMVRSGPVERVDNLGEYLDFKRECDKGSQPARSYERMNRLFGALISRERGSVYGIREGGELMAAAFMARSNTRLVYLQSVSSVKGKELRGMFRIVDEAIREHASSGLLLDFEGSVIPSVARFFAGFGAIPESYQRISFNRLPLKVLSGRVYGS